MSTAPTPEQRHRSARQMMILGAFTMAIGLVIVVMRARTAPLGEALLREGTAVGVGAVVALGGLGERARAAGQDAVRFRVQVAQWVLLVAIAAALGVRAEWDWPVRALLAATVAVGPLALWWERRRARPAPRAPRE